MLALVYFALAACVGDFFCRPPICIDRTPLCGSNSGRVTGQFLVHIPGGARVLLDLTTALVGQSLVLSRRDRGAVLAQMESAIIKHKPGKSRENRAELYLPRPKGSGIADWLLIIGYVVLVSWMMFASFNAKGGKLQIANPEYSDFGPNTALMRSFAVGHDFPTEYPHFSGDRIHYHFLFYFQAGNLEFLGLDPAWSLNVLSITTIVAMLVVLMTLGEVFFNSRAVGRLGRCSFSFSDRSLTFRFFRSKLQSALRFKLLRINGTISDDLSVSR